MAHALLSRTGSLPRTDLVHARAISVGRARLSREKKSENRRPHGIGSVGLRDPERTKISHLPVRRRLPLDVEVRQSVTRDVTAAAAAASVCTFE